MIRSLIIILITMIFCSLSYGQSWEDSLRFGIKLYKEKNYDRAYQSLLSAQKLAPSEVDLSQDIGNAAYRSNDFEMAEKAFRVAANNTNDKSVQAKNWHNVGNSQMKSKNYDAAIESYKEALRRVPNADQTRYNLSEAKRRLALQQKQQQNQKEQNKEQQQDQNQSNKDQNSTQEDHQSNNQSKKNENSANNNSNSKGGQKGDDSNESTAKLSDQKTERMLEQLLKQEIQTKKKVQGNQSNKKGNPTKSGKKW